MNKISFHTDAYRTFLKAFKGQAIALESNSWLLLPSMRLRGRFKFFYAKV